MRHGEYWKDEKGEEYMNDHINGTDWHIPKGKNVLNEDGSWNDKPDEE